MERTGIEPVTSGLQNRRGASYRFPPFPDLAWSSQAPLERAALLARLSPPHRSRFVPAAGAAGTSSPVPSCGRAEGPSGPSAHVDRSARLDEPLVPPLAIDGLRLLGEGGNRLFGCRLTLSDLGEHLRDEERVVELVHDRRRVAGMPGIR